MKIIESISELSDQYDLFLVDQWGVLHDGFYGFPEALNCLEQLIKLRKKVYLISNSAKSAKFSRANLERLNIFQDKHYTDLTTSGQSFLDDEILTKKLGTKAFVFHFSDFEEDILVDYHYTEVSDINDADFVLAKGFDNRYSFEHHKANLDKALKKGLPLVCSNLDKMSLAPDGSLVNCPGLLYEYYLEKQGITYAYGKPLAKIYNNIPKQYLPNSKKRILGIGDSLYHDIKGVKDFGGDGLLIMRGIHNSVLPKNKSNAKFHQKEANEIFSKIESLSKGFECASPEYLQLELKY